MAWHGNAADLLVELCNRQIAPDLVTDQTSAHDALHGYVPAGLPYEDALKLREKDPAEYQRRAMETMARHVQCILRMQKGARITRKLR